MGPRGSAKGSLPPCLTLQELELLTLGAQASLSFIQQVSLCFQLSKYWFLPVLRPQRVSTSSGKKSVSQRGLCSLAGDGSACDRKSRRSAVAIFGARRSQLSRSQKATSYATTLNPKAGVGVQRQSAGRQPVVRAQIPVVQDLLCGNDTQKSPVLQEKGHGVQGKKRPKYRC